MKKNKSIETLITELKNSPPQNNFINTMNAFSDLHQLDSYLIDLLKELPMPVWSYNEEGRVIFWNKEAERKFGFSQLFILNGFDIFGLWVQIRDLDQKAILEKKLKTKSGQYRDINLYVYRKTLNRKESQIWIFGDDHTVVMETVQELEKRFNHLLNLQQIINKSEAIAYIRNNDTNGTFIYISANCNRLGYHPAEFISNEIGLWQLIDTQDIESVNAEVQHAIQNKQSHLRLEYRLINKEGNPLWVSDTFSILYNPEDICTSFQGVITDISLWKTSEARIIAQNKIIQIRNEELFKVNDTLKKSFRSLRETNQKLHESEEKFKALSEQSMLGIIIIHEGTVKYYNQAFLKLCGYDKDEVDQWQEYEFINTVHPQDRPFILNQLDERMKADSLDETNFIFRGINKQNETKWYAQWARTIMYEGKKSTFVTLIDIDERQKWQEALVESEHRLRAKLDLILSPDKSIDNLRFTNIFDTDQLQKIQDAFALSYNITSVITDVEGKPITQPSNISPICQLIRSSKKGQETCELSDKTIGKKVVETLKPHFVTCLSCGFIETGAPIIVAGNHIANWMIGQGLRKKIDEPHLIKIADQFGIERSSLLKAYQQSNFVKLAHIHNIIDFLWLLADEISSLGYNNLILARDVEERKKVEEELIRSKNKAEESDRLKSAFLANMSHEIRTPMNGIVGFANILNEEDLMPDQRKEYIDIINQNASVLLKLFDDILDIAKIEANQIILDEKPCYLDQLLQELYQQFDKMLETREKDDLQLMLTLPEIKLDTLVYIDSSRFKQVMSNLLSNALKFTQKGTIEFGYMTEFPLQLKFFVKDTGIGIVSEKKSLIFDRFRQVDESTSKKYGGTGLGLAICKNLIKLMKGTIWVESEVGKGASFYFTLPYKPWYDDEITKTNQLKDIRLSCDFSDKLILIAEDEQLNFHLLYEQLKNTNAKILHANNGKEAIDLYLKNPAIDIILMDIKMPEMDGYLATREIKALSPLTPIIAITDWIDPEEKIRCQLAGCTHYISKHIFQDKLLNLLHTYFNKIDSTVK